MVNSQWLPFIAWIRERYNLWTPDKDSIELWEEFKLKEKLEDETN